MSIERWRRVDEIFTEAMDQPAAMRADLVRRRCGADSDLHDEIAALLSASARSGDFLASPALDVFARQISREGWHVRTGDRVGVYTIGQRLGAGGMGEVWRARDDRLGRDVAIKLLLPHPSDAAGRVAGFRREARAAGALNHTNILTVYDVGDHDGAPYLVMECLEGESLRTRLARGPLTVDAALDIVLQTSRGLGAAHALGIVHRDLKPENIFLGADGRVKILDFGLASLRDASPHPSTAPDGSSGATQPIPAGTPGYMAPEQVRGEIVDGRADIFSLGAVLYEMLAGRRLFGQGSTLGTFDAVLTVEAPVLSDTNPAVPVALSDVMRRCLVKPAADRFAAAADLESAVAAIIADRHPPRPITLRSILSRPTSIVAVAIVLIACGIGVWQWRQASARHHWARTVAVPDAQRLFDHGDRVEAFFLAREALAVVPDDPQAQQLWLSVSLPQSVVSEPAGADVAIAAYGTSTQWYSLGRTPLTGVRLPRGEVRMRLVKAGFQQIDVTRSPPGRTYRLDPVTAVPPGMVRVAGGRDPRRFGHAGDVGEFWIDRFEVTNRQFKTFVDGGGYQRREYWREPFLDEDRTMTWTEAVGRFRDRTGRPGPATWTSGTYAEGEAELPVSGVSWYEAMAYAAFAGKRLPTMYHWYRAAGLGRFADILTASNFSGVGPASVGKYRGLGTFGTYDMAGNVKEWCSTATNGRRFLLGGAWNEPRYMFADYDARPPFDRSHGNGFRLAVYPAAPLPEILAPVESDVLVQSGRHINPVDDVVFEIYRRQYAYDRSPLQSALEATEETGAWTRYTVSFDAAYGGERVRAYLFIPKFRKAPYQTVIHFPAGDAFQLRSSRDISLNWVRLIIASGRAFFYPVYKGTYERAAPERPGAHAQRDLLIAWARDLGRAIDYLESRADIDTTRLAFYGVSAGADAGVVLTALESRVKVSILQGAGLGLDDIPELDTANYAPRIRMPTLLLNGRYDFEIPFTAAQQPLYDLLGVAPEHKRHVVFETGHALPLDAVSGEVLQWLDRYLGPVDRSPHVTSSR
jgi:serine/threonine protein kinase/formylglycine-generating enzyme required for sulfatase activity